MARHVVVPGYIHNIFGVALEARIRLDRHLSQMTLGLLKKLRLVTSSRSSLPTMREDYRSFGKAVSHLAAMIEREAVKAAPYLRHLCVLTPDVDLISANLHRRREHVSVQMSGVILATEENGGVRRSILRYARFLNYLLRKHHLPMHLDVDFYPVRGEPEALKNLEGVQEYRMNLRLGLTGCYPTDSDTHRRLSYEDVKARQDALIQQGQNPDKVYSQNSTAGIVWCILDYGVYSASNPLLDQNAELPISLLTPELVYAQIPAVTKGIQSLSRKLMYVSSAFTFEH